MNEAVRLSICIATFKRADYIGETLASIVPQLVDGVEVLVFDGASPDATAEVVARFVDVDGRVRYVRADVNAGVDQDFDRAVDLARGEHCWLFADDDLIAPGAVARVLAELERSDPDVLVVDAEVRDRDLDRVLESARIGFAGCRDYGPNDGDKLLADAGNALSFIGCAVVRRSWWRARDRKSYYGSLFIHVGVIFQEPRWTRATVLAEPLVRIRLGNAMWTGRSFEIWMFLWPALIWGLPGYSDAARGAVVAREPWREPAKVLLARAGGGFGPAERRHFLDGRGTRAERAVVRALSIAPGRMVNLLAVCLLGLRGLGEASGMYNIVTTSRYSSRLSRRIARAFGQSSPRKHRP